MCARAANLLRNLRSDRLRARLQARNGGEEEGVETVLAAAAQPKQITLGITFGKCDDDGTPQGMKVVRIKDGGIASLHRGLSVGDLVLSIDDTPLLGLSAVAVNRLIVGTALTRPAPPRRVLAPLKPVSFPGCGANVRLPE